MTTTLKGGQSCVPCTVLSAHRAGMRKLTALWRAGAGAACRRPGEPTPHSACDETKQPAGKLRANLLTQRLDRPAACLSCFTLLFSGLFIFFSPSALQTTSKGCSILQSGHQPCGTQCKHIHLFIHLSNIYQKLPVGLVPAKCLGCSDK